MTTFNVHTIDTAPGAAKPLLEGANKQLGFVPNLLGVMAEAPAALEAYLSLSGLFDKTSFSATERQLILLSVSQTNGCDYCLAAHSAIAGMQKVPPEVIAAARSGGDIPDAKLDALSKLAKSVAEARGWPEQALVEAFFAAGYTSANYLELIVGVTMKTLSNYVNHQAGTPIDEAFKGAADAA